MRDGKIITLYKSKGECSDCNNYCGISLLSIVSKACVVLNRLQCHVYLEAQCRFRAAMAFSVRQLQEKCKEQRQSLHLTFIDLTKTLDLLSRDGLLAPSSGLNAPKLLSMIVSFH